MFDVSKLQPFDLDLGLIAVRDDDAEPWTLRSIAGASVGVDPDDALDACSELYNAVVLTGTGLERGRVKLAEILGNGCNDYQRALWYNLAGRDPLGMVVDLKRLVVLLKVRCDMKRRCALAGWVTVTRSNPYMLDGAAEPRGAYSSDFGLAGFACPPDRDEFVRE